MPPQLTRIFAVIGLSLQLALVAGMIATMIGMMKTFARAQSSVTATAAAELSAGVEEALRFTLMGERIALVGLALFAIALFAGKIRTRWVFWSGWISLLPWPVLFPIGTLIGAVGIGSFIANRKQFLGGVAAREKLPPVSLP